LNSAPVSIGIFLSAAAFFGASNSSTFLPSLSFHVFEFLHTRVEIQERTKIRKFTGTRRESMYGIAQDATRDRYTFT
jgi:hypothetical protein